MMIKIKTAKSAAITLKCSKTVYVSCKLSVGGWWTGGTILRFPCVSVSETKLCHSVSLNGNSCVRVHLISSHLISSHHYSHDSHLCCSCTRSSLAVRVLVLELLAFGFWLLALGSWLLALGSWLLVFQALSLSRSCCSCCAQLLVPL